MPRILSGLGAALGLALLVFGVPIALLAIAGPPLPQELAGLPGRLLRPDPGGRVLMGVVVPLVAWIAWGYFACSLLLELADRLRGRRAVRLGIMRPGRACASLLVGAVAGALALGPASAQALPAQLLGSPGSDGRGAAPPVEVREGDTLWGIAERHLGDGERYPEIALASGIEDPDRIEVGQPIVLPGTDGSEAIGGPDGPDGTGGTNDTGGTGGAAAPDGPGRPDGAADPVEAVPGPAADPRAEAHGAPRERPLSEGARRLPSEGPAADTIRIEVDAAALGGLGAGLAAALLAWLGVRRRAQRRTRPPGMRIAAPSGPAAALERRLRAGADPDEQPGVEAVLRRIGGAAARAGGRPPALSVVRVQDGEHGLYFMAPTELPEPFEPIAEDGSAWRIARPPEPREDDPPNAPYPALVRLGEDEAGGRLLVDLEQIGALSLEGPEPELHRVLAALALELASSPGAATATVTLLGLPPDLAARLETGRLRCAEDPGQLLRQLRGRLGSARQALDSLGLSEVREARLGEEAGAWGPEVVLLGRAPEPETGEALVRAALAAPGGVALVGPGLPGARWRLRVFDAHRASLELPGGSGSIPLRPQRLDEAERERLTGLVDAAFAPPEEGPAWAAALREARSPDPAAPQPAAPPPPARHPEEHEPEEHEPEERRPEEPEADEPEPEGPQAEHREAARPGAAERPAAPAGRRSRDAQREPLDPEARALVDGLARRPWVRLLGPVKLHNAAGEAPRSPQGEALNRSTMNRAAELIAFLALHPGANAVQVHAALWPGRDPHGKAAASSRNGLVSRARRWLGHAPDGEMHFPHIGAAGYRLHEAVTTDWQLFEQLVGEDVGRTPTARLLAALDLVRGAPITAVKDRYYAWAELLRMDMLAGIADVCHELVRRSLGSGDVAGARAAAALARQVDPVNESAWRDALLAEIRAGDAAGFERIVSRLERTLDELELDEEPEPETRALIEEGRRRLARGAA